MPDKNLSMQFFNMYLSNSKVHLLNHFIALQEAATLHKAHATVDAKTFMLEVAFQNKKFLFYPQFLEIKNNTPGYTGDFSKEVVCFIGWRPYFQKTINQFIDKINFKKLVLAQGFSTPVYSLGDRSEMENVIVKLRRSSFGKGMAGPFLEACHYPLTPEKGEFYEQFIRGDIVKILFWNEKPRYVELQSMPMLQGDGKSTIRALAQRRAKKRARSLDECQLAEILEYSNRNLTDILPIKEKVLADFRYESDLAECFSVEELTFPDSKINYLKNELEELGQLLFDKIKQENNHYFCFSVDAILSEDKKLWLLEANSNPTVHPSIYVNMVETLSQMN